MAHPDDTISAPNSYTLKSGASRPYQLLKRVRIGYSQSLGYIFGQDKNTVSVTSTTEDDETIRSVAFFLFRASSDGRYANRHGCCFLSRCRGQLQRPQWTQLVAVRPLRIGRPAKRPSRYHPRSLNLRRAHHWLRLFYPTESVKLLAKGK